MTAPNVDTAARLRLSHDPDEMAHLVCCRAPWVVALCGYRSDRVLFESTFVCTMCVEEAERLRPNWVDEDPMLCLHEDTPCPDEEEIDERIRQETGDS